MAGTRLIGNVPCCPVPAGRLLSQEGSCAGSSELKCIFFIYLFFFRELIQSLREGDGKLCPPAGELVHFQYV